MDILNIRTLLRTKSIYDIPLRVTFYARVSSDTDEQINSLDNQISYYEEFIQKNEKWTYVPGYVDEGLSGISTKKRKHFNEMIADAKEGMFDLIITKEISRFARNTLDSLQYTRELLNMGVGVFFQNDNINTLDEDAELRLTIMSSIAQDELRKLSSRVKFGHQQAIKSSVVLGNSRIFGYKKEDKRLVVDESQAPMVRDLFRLYATGEYSMKQLEMLFYEQGYRNYNGNKIAHTTMSGIISNPKYKGYYVGNKVRIVDMFTKKQKFLPPEEWVMFKDETGEIVPAIVSEEIWDKANEVLARRSEDVKNRQGICNHANLLTGKLYCAHCGTAYYRRESKSKDGKVNSKWVCSNKINNGADACPSFPIYEDEIKPVLFEVFSETRVEIEALLKSYEEMFRSMEADDETAKQMEEQKRIIELADPIELRMASAVLRLLDTLEQGKADDRIDALAALHDEVLIMARTSLRINTGRVLVQIMKELVRDKGDLENQLRLAHDFRQAATGRHAVVRRLLHRYYMLEMPEDWNQAVFDNHVHDANTKGRKNATHLIMDAWLKGIRSLTVIYYNYVAPGAARELLRAAEIMGINVRIGLLFHAPHRGRLVDLIWIPRGVTNADDFIAFIMSAEGQAVIEANGYIAVVEDAPAFAGGKVKGKIVVAGSSSVTPVMEKLKEAYEAINADVEIELQQSDSSSGMTSTIDGVCDIGMASRALKDSEIEKGLTGLTIAMDGIAVIVSLDNPVDGLTTEQVRDIYMSEITDWSEVNE